nr:hypothetical protein [Brasilonema angustatum HA4187-MV1]
MKRFLSFFLTTVVFILSTTFHVLAENDSWDFPNISPWIIGTPQPELQVKMIGSEGLHSYVLVGKVGGIAFEAVAIPEKSLVNQKIELSYDSSQPDGKRLAVSIKGQIYHPVLPDWELVPIANYANSEYNAIVSLFGHNSDDNFSLYSFGRDPGKNFYNITYHRAFNNTLLGVRLLQADTIFMNLNEFWQLPQLKNKTILGYGENQNSVSRQDWQQAAQEIDEVFKGENKTFQSWLFTDVGVNVAFNTQGNNLNLSGSPYYYFWRSDFTEYKRQRAEYEKQVAEYERQLAEYRKQADSLPTTPQRNEIVQKHNALVSKRNEIVQKANNLQPKVFE